MDTVPMKTVLNHSLLIALLVAGTPILAHAEANDADKDGLTDDREAQLGTDPNNPDTDGDGVMDGLEVDQYGSDPLKADMDDDGLTDDRELFDYFTDVANPDTDGDGLQDGEEVDVYSTDPLNFDTDGDGVADGQQVGGGPDSDGLDTDGDGLSDNFEATVGSDPTNPDSDGDGIVDGDEIVNLDGSDIIDVDGDGTENFYDLDSDNDGILDSVEGQIDTDGDGVGNAYDLDSDDDGISDLEETGGVDEDFNQLIDNFTDADGDGFDDALTDITTFLPDSDANGIPDYLDNPGLVVTPAASSNADLTTGIQGNGCTFVVNQGAPSSKDPSFPALLGLALLGLFYSRKAHGRKACTHKRSA